jgi:hypothetical protein
MSKSPTKTPQTACPRQRVRSHVASRGRAKPVRSPTPHQPQSLPSLTPSMTAQSQPPGRPMAGSRQDSPSLRQPLSQTSANMQRNRVQSFQNKNSAIPIRDGLPGMKKVGPQKGSREPFDELTASQSGAGTPSDLTQAKPAAASRTSTLRPKPRPRQTHFKSQSVLNGPTFLPTSDTEYPIPETYPRRVKSLWRKVVTAEGRGRGLAPRSRPPSSRTSSQSRTTKTADKEPNWQEWRNQNLDPLEITIGTSTLRTALGHFGYDEDEFGNWISKKLEESDRDGLPTVWLRGGHVFNERIAKEYKEMKALNLCEEEFASVAKEEILLREPRLPIEGGAKKWQVERMIQLLTVPSSAKDSKWISPPVIDRSKDISRYNFRLKPDCAYWLSLKAFSESHRDLVSDAAHTVDDRITCPYFTVEFKKSNNTVEQAINQVTATSALTLYNRYLLKNHRLKAGKQQWNEKHFQQIRHYALTFTGATAVVWVMQPKSAGTLQSGWKGCEMTRLWTSNCATRQGIQDLVDWVNAIHRWGLEQHGRFCQDDIKVVLGQHCDIRGRLSDLFDPDLTLTQELSGHEAEEVGPKPQGP